MIELQFKGTRAEVISEVIAFADTMAIGLQVRDRMTKSAEVLAAAKAETPATPPVEAPAEVVVDTLVAEPKKPRGRPKKTEAVTIEHEPTQSATDVFDEAVAGNGKGVAVEALPADESADEPVPTTVEEMKALANQAVAKAGPDKVKTIINQYANKVSNIDPAKYAEFAGKLRAVMGAA